MVSYTGPYSTKIGVGQLNIQGWVGNSTLDLEDDMGRELSRVLYHFEYEFYDAEYQWLIGQ